MIEQHVQHKRDDADDKNAGDGAENNGNDANRLFTVVQSRSRCLASRRRGCWGTCCRRSR